MDPEVVLAFWFKDPARWFRVDPAFDDEIRTWYADIVKAVAMGEDLGLRETPRGRLATIILLDQFPRNIWRGTPESFAYDHLALLAAEDALAKGDDAVLAPMERHFLYMPLMHAEDPKVQDRSVALFERLEAENPGPETATALHYAREHRDTIARFNRFPTRNHILGRVSTDDEVTFLREEAVTSR
jgi:uncharacterized protein (DUF924 family)